MSFLFFLIQSCTNCWVTLKMMWQKISNSYYSILRWHQFFLHFQVSFKPFDTFIGSVPIVSITMHTTDIYISRISYSFLLGSLDIYRAFQSFPILVCVPMELHLLTSFLICYKQIWFSVLNWMVRLGFKVHLADMIAFSVYIF